MKKINEIRPIFLSKFCWFQMGNKMNDAVCGLAIIFLTFLPISTEKIPMPAGQYWDSFCAPAFCTKYFSGFICVLYNFICIMVNFTLNIISYIICTHVSKVLGSNLNKIKKKTLKKYFYFFLCQMRDITLALTRQALIIIINN